MRVRWYAAVLFVMLGLTACGRGAHREEAHSQMPAESTSAKEEHTQEVKPPEETEESADRGSQEETGKVPETQEDSARPSRPLSDGTEGSKGATAEYVGLRGHIKELREDMALISSDVDEFPGVFWVTEAERIAVPEELKGGASVFVLMEDTGERESDGLERYRGIQLFVVPRDEETGKADVLLTAAPPLVLTDALSSRYEPFEIRPGNYTWDTGGSAVVACGAAPLEEASTDRVARLKLARYNKMDQVFYTMNTVIAPDILVISQWDISQLGCEEAKEESRTTYYGVMPGLSLKKDKVYEIGAQWKKEKLEENGFWGQAGYVLVTE